MQAYALQVRRGVAAAVSLALFAASQPLYPAEIPIKRIVLYKHGIAYFEREGAVPGGEEVRLDFKTTDRNDVLKSLTVEDSGGRVAGVRYDSNEPLDQQLSKFPFKIGDEEYLSAFLDRIKGARVQIKLGDRPVSGVIMSSRSIEAGSDGERAGSGTDNFAARFGRYCQLRSRQYCRNPASGSEVRRRVEALSRNSFSG